MLVTRFLGRVSLRYSHFYSHGKLEKWDVKKVFPTNRLTLAKRISCHIMSCAIHYLVQCRRSCEYKKNLNVFQSTTCFWIMPWITKYMQITVTRKCWTIKTPNYSEILFGKSLLSVIPTKLSDYKAKRHNLRTHSLLHWPCASRDS